MALPISHDDAVSSESPSSETDAAIQTWTPIFIDDLIRLPPHEDHHIPRIAYPRSERGVVDFECYTSEDLNRFACAAAQYYIKCGLRPLGTVSVMSDHRNNVSGAEPCVRMNRRPSRFWLLQI